MDSPRGLLRTRFAPCTKQKLIAVCLFTYLTLLIVLVIVMLEYTSEPLTVSDVNKTLNKTQNVSLLQLSELNNTIDSGTTTTIPTTTTLTPTTTTATPTITTATPTSTTTITSQTTSTAPPGRPCKDRHKWCNYACCTCERCSDGSCFIRYEEPGPKGGINIRTEDI